MGFKPAPIVDSPFWNEQAARFASLRHEPRQSKTPLEASFDPEGWGVDSFRAFQGSTSACWVFSGGSAVVISEFKSVAGVCAVAIGTPNTDSAWVEWLDCLRRESPDFIAAELFLETYSREPRPEPDYEVSAQGLLYPPPDLRPDPEPKVIRSEIGRIPDVCAASERVCRRLADEALKTALGRSGGTVAVNVSSLGPDAENQEIGSLIESLPVGHPAAMSDRTAVPIEAANLHGVGDLIGGRRETVTGPDVSKTMTLKEAAKALRVSVDTLQRMRKRGEIELFKAGSRWKVKASEVFRLREHPKLASR